MSNPFPSGLQAPFAHGVLLVASSSGVAKAERRAMRRHLCAQARTFRLNGVVLRQETYDLYGLEGPSAVLSETIEALCSQAGLEIREVSRVRGKTRAYAEHGLIAADISAQEHAWLNAQFECDFAERAVLPPFLTWAALRQREALMGGARFAALQPDQSFPFPKARRLHPAPGFLQ